LKEVDGKKIATAEVPEDQFSLAIGKGDQNVRLASRLTGWSIDIIRAEDAEKKEEKEVEKIESTKTE
jgi:N utilization substance protein A